MKTTGRNHFKAAIGGKEIFLSRPNYLATLGAVLVIFLNKIIQIVMSFTGPCPLKHSQPLSSSIIQAFPFITAESVGFALAERSIRILLLTTNKSHVLRVPISNLWGPATLYIHLILLTL